MKKYSFQNQQNDRAEFEEGIAFIEDAKITLNGYIKFLKSQNQNMQ